MKTNIICLLGPTASGKTQLALDIAEAMPCDIISVDSAMVYRGMDIGTAKPSSEVLKKFPHQLIDLCDPSESYSAGQFCADAIKAIENSINQQRTPLLVGGTMMYFHALQQGIAPLPQANTTIREDIVIEAEAFGWEALHKQLTEIDPIAAERIHPNDQQRIQRALEVYRLTGKSITEFSCDNDHPLADYNVINIALLPTDRSLLHTRIEQRFDQMLDQGFLDEVAKLYSRDDLHADLPAIRAVGYRQFWQHLTGVDNYVTAREKAIIATRQLAKRQITWLRSWSGMKVFDSNGDSQIKSVLDYLTCSGE